MADHTDEEREAREQLIDAQVEAEETLEAAERLEENAADDGARNDSGSE